MADVDHRAPRRAGRRHLGRPAAALPRRGRLVDSRQLRFGEQPHLLVDVAGEAVGQPHPGDRRRRPLQQQRAGARRRHRRAVVVLPVHAGRDPRPRRRVRERAHRPRRPAVAVQDGQARHPVGARPRHRRVRRRPRSRLPGRARRRSGDGEGDLPAREDAGEGRRARVLPRFRRHPELARLGLPPRDEGALHPHPPDLRQRRLHRDRAGARRQPTTRTRAGCLGAAPSIPTASPTAATSSRWRSRRGASCGATR